MFRVFSETADGASDVPFATILYLALRKCRNLSLRFTLEGNHVSGELAGEDRLMRRFQSLEETPYKTLARG